MSTGRNIPWVCLGDFNEILFQSEKKGKKDCNPRQMRDFSEAIEAANLGDLGYSGHIFTWSNGRKGDEEVCERLDRALVNEEWRKMYPTAIVSHEISAHSVISPFC